ASSIFTAATILGPIVGGLIYAFARGPIAVYATSFIAAGVAIALILKIPAQEKPRVRPDANLSTVFEGFRYIWREKLILFAISLVALFLVGATDMVSVIVRATLIQVATPDEMRGRVNAVDMIFIGASNELGQFESGITAQWFGAVPAVILGGIAAIVVTGLWAWMFPELRKVKQLTLDKEETKL